MHHIWAFTAAIVGTFLTSIIFLIFCCLCHKTCVWKRKVDRLKFLDAIRQKNTGHSNPIQENQECQYSSSQVRQTEANSDLEQQRLQRQQEVSCSQNDEVSSGSQYVINNEESRDWCKKMSLDTQEAQEEEIPLESYGSEGYTESSFSSVTDESKFYNINLN